MQLLKKSTAATILVGPVLDSTGAVYTGAVVGDFSITKNGTVATMAAAATATHDHNGHYLIALTTGNTDAVGRLVISCNKSTYAMPPAKYEVLEAAVYDVLTGTTAPSTLTGAAAASAVRAELATELARIDAAITTRSTYAGGDTSGTTTLLARLTSGRAGYLDNLSVAPPTAAEVADKLLGRAIAGGADGGRTVSQSLQVLRNKVTRAAGTLTVYAADDSTPSWTATYTTDAAAAPITGVDPA